MRTVIMTEDGPELVQLVDGAPVWPPDPTAFASRMSAARPAPSPSQALQPLSEKSTQLETPHVSLVSLYEILVGPSTIRLVSAASANSSETR